MTLLERRKRHLTTEIEWLIQEVDRLRKAVDSGVDDPHGVGCITASVFGHAQLAAAYARQVEDLSDVEKYGAGGGR